MQCAVRQFLHLLSGVGRVRSSTVSASLSLIPSVPVYRRDSRDPAHVKVVSRTAVAQARRNLSKSCGPTITFDPDGRKEVLVKILGSP